MSNYKRGEIVWVLHKPHGNSDQQKIINVKVFSGESYAGYYGTEIGYKYGGEKETVNTDYVAYSRDELIDKLVARQKNIEQRITERLSKEIEKLTNEMRDAQERCAWWINFYEKQRETDANDRTTD